MSYITATELQILSFFEVEPSKLDPNDPWIYNDCCYQVDAGGLSLSCSIAPAYKDVRITLKQGDARIYELNARAIEDLRYHQENNRESLEFILGPNETLWLRLKPSIELLHEHRESA